MTLKDNAKDSSLNILARIIAERYIKDTQSKATTRKSGENAKDDEDLSGFERNKVIRKRNQQSKG
jgi:hypothetical protein